MGTSLGVVRHDGAHLVEARRRSCRGRAARCSCTQPDTDSLKCRFAAGVDAPQLLNTDAAGRRRALRLGRAQPAHARQRRPARHVRGGRASEPTRSCKSAIVCPLYFNDTFIGCLALYHIEPNRYTEDHRRLLERIAEQAGAGHPQLDRLRADAGRFADRSAHRPAEPPVDVRAPVARAGARRAPRRARSRSSSWTSTGSRRSTTPTATTSATTRCARSRRRCRARCGPTTCACATPATSSSSCSPTARARRPRPSGASCRSASPRSSSKCAPGKRLRLAVSAGASVFPHDGTTYEALLADADQRMYRDKAARRGEVVTAHPFAPAHFPLPPDDLFDQPADGALRQTVA